MLQKLSVNVRQWGPWAVVLLGSFLLAAAPFALFRLRMGVWLPEVLPQVSSDALYYVKQMREVIDGHPWLGSPFIRDHADAYFPGLLLPMWLGAAPGFFGLGINGIFVFNTIFWGVLTGALLYSLSLRLTRGNVWIAVLTTLIGLLSLHNFLIRPILQIVYPALAVFLFFLLGVLEKPHGTWRYAGLGLAAVFAFYLYPHLWMPVFAATGFLTVRALWMRDAAAVRCLGAMWIGIAAACLPQILVIIRLFSDPEAQALSIRSGLVETHRVLPLTVLNLKYMILAVLGITLIRSRRPLSHAEWALLLISGGILSAAFSNVITGKEMEFETHPLWVAFFLNAVALAVFANSYLRSMGLARTISALIACAFLFTLAARTVRNSLTYLWRFDAAAAQELQEFRPVLSFLERATPAEEVILAPNLLGKYIPIYLDDYVFFDKWALLHVIPKEELLERFLTQHVDTVTEESLRRDLTFVAGWGPGRAVIYRRAYGDAANPLDFFGGEDFILSAVAKHRVIRARYAQYLRKYDVKFAVTDAQAKDNPRVPAGSNVLYRDERFTVYGL